MKKIIIIFLIFVCAAVCAFARKTSSQKISTTQSISYIGGKYTPQDSPFLSVSQAMESNGKGKFLLKYDFTVQKKNEKYPVLCMIVIPKNVYREARAPNNLSFLRLPVFLLSYYNRSAHYLDYDKFRQVGGNLPVTKSEFIAKVANSTVDDAVKIVQYYVHSGADMVIPPYAPIERYIFDEEIYVLPILLPAEGGKTASIELLLDVSQIDYDVDDMISIGLKYFYLYTGGYAPLMDDYAFALSDRDFKITLTK